MNIRFNNGLYCVYKGFNVLFRSEYEIDCEMFIEEIQNDGEYDI